MKRHSKKEKKVCYRLARLLQVLSVFCLSGVMCWWSNPAAAGNEKPLDSSLEGLEFSVTAYVDYSSGEHPLPAGEEENYNDFSLTRGYFTIKKVMTDWMRMRLTTDLKQESKDPGTKLHGSYVVRTKYFYAEFLVPDVGPFTGMKAEVGLGHMPWLDFEEHNQNPYRCQGTMPIERAHVFNSADTGISLRGNLGGELEGGKEKTGNKHYNGRYGSWHVGVYNGGGYHEVEKNQNKVAEGRVSLRPLPEHLPGLQLSYLGIYGEGNVETGEVVAGTTIDEIPDYNVNLYMVSFEHPALNFNYQYFTTRGNKSGAWTDPAGDALDTQGWSTFLRASVPSTGNRLSIFGRYDYFDIDPDNEWAEDTAYTMTTAGMSYDFSGGNMLVLAWESTDYQDDADVKGKLPVKNNELGEEEKYQAVWQIKF
ncbi:MAG: hypothetical protein R6V10_09860 [bacterium]